MLGLPRTSIQIPIHPPPDLKLARSAFHLGNPACINIDFLLNGQNTIAITHFLFHDLAANL
jgi:hypothetical protein